MEALQWIVPVTIGQASEAAGPISPDTYYWHNGRVQRITQRNVDGDATGILIEGPFADAIDRVAAQAQGSRTADQEAESLDLPRSGLRETGNPPAVTLPSAIGPACIQ